MKKWKELTNKERTLLLVLIAILICVIVLYLLSGSDKQNDSDDLSSGNEIQTELETVPEASTPVEINSESETESESYVIVSKDGLDHSNDPHPEPNYTEVDLDTGLVPWPEIEYVQVMGITQEILDDMGLTAKELWRKVHKCLHNLGYCEHGAMARFATFKGREVDELDHKVIYYFFELTGDYIGPDTGITIYKYHNQWEMCRGYHIYEYHD